MADGPTWGERVVVAVSRLGPLCAGLDPSADILGAWGLADDPGGLARFCEVAVGELAGVVPVVKFQVAFFERHGSAGLAVLETAVAECRRRELLAICDAKRGDVGSTVEGYADAWFRGPLAGDAVTASPYLGVGALEPMAAAARQSGKGLVVVAASSNPEGRVLQEAVTATGRRVEDQVLAEVAAANAAEGAGVGSIGAVVGATRSPGTVALSSLRGILLAPGVGAQGAGPDDVRALFAGCAPGSVLPSSSRGLLSAGPDGLAQAAHQAIEAMSAAIG
jgi:orotidine-5'-phosphate decarboxylase